MLGQGAQYEVQRFVQSAFSMASFFYKYFVRKNWRGGGELNELLLKNGTIDGYAY